MLLADIGSVGGEFNARRLNSHLSSARRTRVTGFPTILPIAEMQANSTLRFRVDNDLYVADSAKMNSESYLTKRGFGISLGDCATRVLLKGARRLVRGQSPVRDAS